VPGAGPEGRRAPRYNVHLRVRFASALEFVTEYAENLSSNGLFIRSDGALAPLDELGVELTLPGFGAFTVRVRVAHVLSPDLAARMGRPAGAGVEILERPAGFDAAMAAYLAILGRRRDHAVWCHDDGARDFFDRMGYRAGPTPALGALVGELGKSPVPVVAVVVPRDVEGLFRRTLAPAGAADRVRVADDEAALDAVLADLDQTL
jgi:hypothetical protein